MKKIAAFLLSAALLVWCLQEESNDPAIVEMTNTEGRLCIWDWKQASRMTVLN